MSLAMSTDLWYEENKKSAIFTDYYIKLILFRTCPLGVRKKTQMPVFKKK